MIFSRRDMERAQLPVAIVAKPEDLRAGAYNPWRLVYDQVASMRMQDGGMVRRMLRVSEARGPGRAPFRSIAEDEAARRERQAKVAELADEVIRGRGVLFGLREDFDLEGEVLDELWRRWREVTADGFLMRALTPSPADGAREEGKR